MPLSLGKGGPAQSLVVSRDSSIGGRLDAAMLEAFLQTELLQQSSGMVCGPTVDRTPPLSLEENTLVSCLGKGIVALSGGGWIC